MQKDNILQQIKDKIEYKKYKKLLHKATLWINETVDNIDGFKVPYKLDQDSGRLILKQITPDSFEHAFHIDVWNNMTVPEQILSLIWFDKNLAKEQNRPNLAFVLNPYIEAYSFDLENYTLKLNVPTYLFETNQKSSYEHMHIISKMGVIIRDAHYKSMFLETGENKGSFDEIYMSVADTLVHQPESYKKIVVQAYDQNELTEEDKEHNKKYYEPLTQEEKEDNLLYLLQPRQSEWWKEYQKIESIGDRNVYYMGEDYNFEQYKKTVAGNKTACDKFIEEQTKNLNKNDLFFELLEASNLEEEENER